jgi:hypothetical protein
MELPLRCETWDSHSGTGFWGVMLRSLVEVYPRTVVTCSLHHKDPNIMLATRYELVFMLDIHFDPANGGSMFLETLVIFRAIHGVVF